MGLNASRSAIKRNPSKTEKNWWEKAKPYNGNGEGYR